MLNSPTICMQEHYILYMTFNCSSYSSARPRETCGDQMQRLDASGYRGSLHHVPPRQGSLTWLLLPFPPKSGSSSVVPTSPGQYSGGLGFM
jgi:hypothetical protein